MTDDSKAKLEREILAIRDESIKAFATLTANLNKAIVAVLGPDAVDNTGHTTPATAVVMWEGDRLAQLNELVRLIAAETTDTDQRDIILRALAVYRSHVTHTREGGHVIYHYPDGRDPRTLKVRLK